MPDFIQEYLKNSRILRAPLRELRKAEEDDSDEIISRAYASFDRTDDIGDIKRLYKDRFTTGIKRSAPKADSITSSSHEYYTREADAKAVDMGHMPIVSTGLGIQIAQALATLTTQPGQRYEYTIDGAADEEGNAVKAEEAEAVISTIRDKGAYDIAVATADYMSVCVKSSALHCYWGGRTLRYDAILPSDIRFIFGNMVNDDGIERRVDYTDIEDASAVIIQTKSAHDSTSAAPENKSWLAYVGACPEHPDGRMVSYEARDYWPIPEVGDPVAVDYRHDGTGDVCNPLTYLMNHGGELSSLALCEYPVSICHGGIRKSSELMPRSTSLYEASREVEIAWSQLLKTALESARGKDVFTKSDVAGSDLPKSLNVVVCEPGIEYDVKGVPANNSVAASDVVKIVAQQTAGGFGVPGYMVTKGGAVPEAGIALAIQTQPLVDNRNRRTKINKHFISRNFDIERGLLAEYTGLAVIGADVVQSWTPGKWTPPRDEKAELEIIQGALDAYVINQVDAVKRFHPEITTDAEAIALIEKYKEQDPSYTPYAEPKADTGFGAPE